MVYSMTIIIGSAIVFFLLAYLLFFNKKIEEIEWMEMIITVIWLISGIILAIGLLYHFGVWILMSL